MKPTKVFSISKARYLAQDRSEIDMVVQTDVGDFPFLYSIRDEAPLALLVKKYLEGKPDLPIAAYKTKGGDK
jgi:hypothetical protein